jgi:hypothetical protein
VSGTEKALEARFEPAALHLPQQHVHLGIPAISLVGAMRRNGDIAIALVAAGKCDTSTCWKP